MYIYVNVYRYTNVHLCTSDVCILGDIDHNAVFFFHCPDTHIVDRQKKVHTSYSTIYNENSSV